MAAACPLPEKDQYADLDHCALAPVAHSVDGAVADFVIDQQLDYAKA